MNGERDLEGGRVRETIIIDQRTSRCCPCTSYQPIFFIYTCSFDSSGLQSLNIFESSASPAKIEKEQGTIVFIP